MCQARNSITDSLFECRAEISLALTRTNDLKMLSRSQREELRILIEQIEGVEISLDALVAA